MDRAAPSGVMLPDKIQDIWNIMDISILENCTLLKCKFNVFFSFLFT